MYSKILERRSELCVYLNEALAAQYAGVVMIHEGSLLLHQVNDQLLLVNVRSQDTRRHCMRLFPARLPTTTPYITGFIAKLKLIRL